MNRPRVHTPFVEKWIQRDGTFRNVEYTLGKETTKRIIERVRGLGITVNEAMLLACARSLYHWIRGQGRIPEKISICIPVDLRPYFKIKPLESIANSTMSMNINIRASLIEDAPRLIKSIRVQSHAIKKLRLPVIGILLTSFIAWPPLRILRRMVRWSVRSGQAEKNTPTLNYSNVGMMFLDEKGEPVLIPVGPKAVMEAFSFSNPIAYPVGAHLVTLTYGGRILVSLSHLDPILKTDQMKAFLKRFHQELLSAMDEKDLMEKTLPPFRSAGNGEDKDIADIRVT